MLYAISPEKVVSELQVQRHSTIFYVDSFVHVLPYFRNFVRCAIFSSFLLQSQVWRISRTVQEEWQEFLTRPRHLQESETFLMY
jgi:hypothetical protein